MVATAASVINAVRGIMAGFLSRPGLRAGGAWDVIVVTENKRNHEKGH